jgi:uncharacterized repeat protein (TIGR04138 family)
MDQIRLREPRYAEGAYLFVLAALEFRQSQLHERRHISAQELALACRDLALHRYGVMARVVLEQWGLRSTDDIGAVVFTLVELEYLSSLPNDTREQFDNLFDFVETFDVQYPWNGAVLV